MRRFVLLLAAATLFVPNNSNVVVAESNADDLIRLRFESTVSHVYDSHPSLQVGDKVHFELTVDPSNSVPDDGHSFLSECEIFAGDPDMNYSGCEQYGWNVPGSSWVITYLRNGETVYTESGDANYLLGVEGGREYWCDPECVQVGNGRDYFYVYASSWSDDVMYFHNFDGDFDPTGVSAAGLIDDAIDNTLWDIGMFDYRRPTWHTYHYDYLTPQDHATVIRQTSIGFDATGGSDEPTAIVEDAGSVVVVPDDVPTRTGFVFEGWNTTEDGSGQTYVAGNAITLPATGSLSLYAQWVQELASETTVVDTTTPSDVTLPATGSSGGSMSPVLLALGFGGLLALFARRRVTER